MEIIKKYFPNLSAIQLEKFGKLGALYNEWNQKINVISRKDINELYTRHVLHSLGIAKFCSFSPGTSIIDVGTGGGFPGIPLAIMFPNCQFHLIDSISKKITVVNAIANNLELTNVKGEQARIQDIKLKYDFIISRAVTAFPTFVEMSKHVVKTKNINSISNGILYLKGGDFSNELKSFKNNCSVIELTDFFNEDFFETKKLIHLSI
ncbi:MAG: 16S rRNA (guanine(527)-N(7))-methyltransferase RsmG [Marinilabiliaceae bacterium]|nr:16S rRNA (guanine(527)-N(7))-methyltransferase RsmG [Marinilabiliaceae bacterium]